MFPRVEAPVSGIQHSEQNCQIYLNSSDRGNGTLYISENRLIWEDEEHRGLSLGYRSIALHAISKDLQAFPKECLYVMYNGEVVDTPPEGAANQNGHTNGNTEESSDEEMGADDSGTISEIRFIPQNKENLKQMFEAMSACQCLHPDSEDSDDYYEGDQEEEEGAVYDPMTFEDGAGEGFYTSEEGFEHLTPQGQATLQRLENMLAESQISQGISEMVGVQVEDDDDAPDPSDAPVVGRTQNNDSVDNNTNQEGVEGQFDDAE